MIRFTTEKKAEAYLLKMLNPYFSLMPQCWLTHIETGQKLRIDFLAKPKKTCDFPYPIVGIEVKRGNYSKADGVYNRALFQCLDYTRCTISDFRIKKHADERLEKVYLWPGLDGNSHMTTFGANRLIGIGHVGTILERCSPRRPFGDPVFLMCEDRQWCGEKGARRAFHKTAMKLGSGIKRIDTNPKA
jgi:hypothetical protein